MGMGAMRSCPLMLVVELVLGHDSSKGRALYEHCRWAFNVVLLPCGCDPRDGVCRNCQRRGP
eukprot:9499240-Pyramimonas_sp.AAC.2